MSRRPRSWLQRQSAGGSTRTCSGPTTMSRRSPGSVSSRASGRSGAAALGMAGGDGSLGAVAGEALEHDVPFVCVPFGTRNHFARDLGLDCDDPVSVLDAFRGGEERRVDVGTVDGRVFLNNVSLGLYASLVHDPAHETKNRLVAALRMIPAAFGKSRRPLDLTVEVEGRIGAAKGVGAPRGEQRLRAGCTLGPGPANPARRRDASMPMSSRLWIGGVWSASSRERLSGRIGPTEGWVEWTSKRLEVAAKRHRASRGHRRRARHAHATPRIRDPPPCASGSHSGRYQFEGCRAIRSGRQLGSNPLVPPKGGYSHDHCGSEAQASQLP